MFFKYETICEHFICSFWAKIGCRKLIFCDTDRFFRPSSTKVTKVFACSFYEALSSKKLSHNLASFAVCYRLRCIVTSL